MEPLAGALDFTDWLRERFQVVILSDTFYEFAAPLMKKLGYPTLLCNRLIVDKNGFVTDYKLRQPDQKRKSVQAFHSLNYRVIAAGDSYNDMTMLSEADAGILYCPPDNVVAEYPQFPVTSNYDELREAFLQARNGL
jgi:phosphoserine/homoserine phosphotransferase